MGSFFFSGYPPPAGAGSRIFGSRQPNPRGTGARPARAQLVHVKEDDFDTLSQLAAEAAGAYSYGTNMRGSGEYRQFLAETYTRRLMEKLRGRSVSRQ